MTDMSLPFLSAINRCFHHSFDVLLSDEFFERVRSSGVIDVQQLVRIDFLYFHTTYLINLIKKSDKSDKGSDISDVSII
jgi:hypothetical protein